MSKKRPDFTERRNAHAARVTRESVPFMSWYDKAAAMVFDGTSKGDTIDALAPWGCEATQSNGVVAGALQASALMK